MYRGATTAPSIRAESNSASAGAKGSSHASPTGKSRNGATPSAIALAKRLGLRYVSTHALSIRRQRRGKGWIYIGVKQLPIRDPKIVRRLAAGGTTCLCRRALCGGCRRASSGGRARCCRPTPIPLPRTMGGRAGVAQEPPPCSFSGRATPRTRDEQASRLSDRR